MNIGKLDTKVAVYERTLAQNDYGEMTAGSDTIDGYAWVKRINKKSTTDNKGASIQIGENSYEFLTRYNSSIWFIGRYFQIVGESTKYWVRGVEEIGRKEGMMIMAERTVAPKPF